MRASRPSACPAGNPRSSTDAHPPFLAARTVSAEQGRPPPPALWGLTD